MWPSDNALWPGAAEDSFASHKPAVEANLFHPDPLCRLVLGAENDLVAGGGDNREAKDRIARLGGGLSAHSKEL